MSIETGGKLIFQVGDTENKSYCEVQLTQNRREDICL